jgi:hypothetical protein
MAGRFFAWPFFCFAICNSIIRFCVCAQNPTSMQRLFISLLCSIVLLIKPVLAAAPVNPFTAFSKSWSAALYTKANTGAKAIYLNKIEKEILQVLNLVRMNPVLYATTVLPQFPKRSHQFDIAQSAEYKSLYATLMSMKPLPVLQPDSLSWVSARCHAISSGQQGYVGHDRITADCEKVEQFDAESCHYGYNNAIDIVTSLLIDKDVPSLGHRTMLLGNYKKVGIAMASHTEYGTTAVLDFKR